jgi:hypothetical protein
MYNVLKHVYQNSFYIATSVSVAKNSDHETTEEVISF